MLQKKKKKKKKKKKTDYYKQLIWFLFYGSTTKKKKKLDIAFSVNQATRFSKNSTEARYSNIKNTLKVSITPYLDKYVTKKKKNTIIISYIHIIFRGTSVDKLA